MSKDYYKTLELSRDASPEQVKASFRKLAMKYHPDKNKGDKASEAKFKEVNEAYETLRDPQKRSQYDAFGSDPTGDRGGPFGGGNASRGGGQSGFGADFSDIFADIFGQHAQKPSRTPGVNIEYEVELSLEEAYAGKTAKINFSADVQCTLCNGTGSKSTKTDQCLKCHGSGSILVQRGFFRVEQKCPDCYGEGVLMKDPCSECKSSGVVKKNRTLVVNIPRGVDSGMVVRISGEGGAGRRKAPSGDLHLSISVRAHPLFLRDGSDLTCKIPIPMTLAALGGDIAVPTIEGKKVSFTIPVGTQSGDKFRLRGKGMSKLKNAGCGDMYINVAVETPTNLTTKQKSLLSQFAEETSDKSNPKSSSFLKKVSDLFKSAKGS